MKIRADFFWRFRGIWAAMLSAAAIAIKRAFGRTVLFVAAITLTVIGGIVRVLTSSKRPHGERDRER